MPVGFALSRYDCDFGEQDEGGRHVRAIGQWITQYTPFEATILSNLDWWPQVIYYADRNIIYRGQSQEQFDKTVSREDARRHYFLFYNKAPYDKDLMKKLRENYKLKSKYGTDFSLFELK
jgi:hypothetical protein